MKLRKAKRVISSFWSGCKHPLGRIERAYRSIYRRTGEWKGWLNLIEPIEIWRAGHGWITHERAILNIRRVRGAMMDVSWWNFGNDSMPEWRYQRSRAQNRPIVTPGPRLSFEQAEQLGAFETAIPWNPPRANAVFVKATVLAR